jgi:cytidylate kinase
VTESLVIAVDGPAGSGKSSAARGVAAALGLRYLDTGAMYRALTWWLLDQGLDITDPQVVAKHAGEPAIAVTTDPAAPSVTADGTDISAEIRSRSVSNAVSAVAAVPQVRARLVPMQQEIIAHACAAGPGIVAEGRDIGTVVAPHAAVKVFLTADETARATRRTADLAGDPAATADVTQAENRRRDSADARQSAMAPDAVGVDTTHLTLDGVITLIVGLASGHGARIPGPRDAARIT